MLDDIVAIVIGNAVWICISTAAAAAAGLVMACRGSGEAEAEDADAEPDELAEHAAALRQVADHSQAAGASMQDVRNAMDHLKRYGKKMSTAAQLEASGLSLDDFRGARNLLLSTPQAIRTDIDRIESDLVLIRANEPRERPDIIADVAKRDRNADTGPRPAMTREERKAMERLRKLQSKDAGATPPTTGNVWGTW